MRDGRVRLLGGPGERAGQQPAGALSGLLCLLCPLCPLGRLVAEYVGHAAQELRQDRPGVPAGSHQGSVRPGPYGLGQGGPPCAVGHLGEGLGEAAVGRFGGEVEVGAGVRVGDRVDVDRVDVLAGPAQCGQGQRAPGAHRFGVELVRALRLRLVRHRAFLLVRARVHRRVTKDRPGVGTAGRGQRRPW